MRNDLKEAKRTADRLREQAVTLRRTKGGNATSSTTSSVVEGNQRKNEERIKVLEAQVKAYKSELARMEASAAKKSGKSSGKVKVKCLVLVCRKTHPRQELHGRHRND